MIVRNYYLHLQNLPSSSSVGLLSDVVDVGDMRTLVVGMVTIGGLVAARVSLVEVDVVVVAIELLVVVLGLVDCTALLVMIGTETSTAVVVVAVAIAVDIVVVISILVEAESTAVVITVAEAEASAVAVPVSMTEVASTSVALVFMAGISAVVVLGIIKVLLEEFILVDITIVLRNIIALVEVPEVIITEIESAIVESNTKEVIAVVLGFSVDIKLVELILAIIVGLISDVVEEASVVSETLVLYSGPVPHLLLTVTVIV